MDTTIRRRQREAAAGDPAAEAAWLVERLRAAPVCERCDASTYGAGTLRVATTTAALVMCPACAGTGSPFRARLELAAYCGSEAARAALGSDWPNAPWGRYTAEDGRTYEVPPAGRGASPGSDSWLRGLSRWADVGHLPGWVLVRAAAAAARVALDAEPNGCGPGDATWHDGPECCPVHAAQRRTIEAAEAWLYDPTEERMRAVERACGDVGPRMRFASSLVHVLGPEIGVAHYFRDVVEDSAERAGEAPVRSAICSALVAWALA